MSSSALEPTLGTAPWSAVTTYVQNDDGLVVRGVERQPRYGTARPSAASASHSASSVVLPNPAGADTSVSLASAPRRRRSSESRPGHQTASQLGDVQLGCNQRTRHAIPIPSGTTVSLRCVPQPTLRPNRLAR